MRVLVTGAYGFIGSHIVAALTAAGHEVVCAVRGNRIDQRFAGLRAVACDMARAVAAAVRRAHQVQDGSVPTLAAAWRLATTSNRVDAAKPSVI